jgi:hypothetical protein
MDRLCDLVDPLFDVAPAFLLARRKLQPLLAIVLAWSFVSRISRARWARAGHKDRR